MQPGDDKDKSQPESIHYGQHNRGARRAKTESNQLSEISPIVIQFLKELIDAAEAVSAI